VPTGPTLLVYAKLISAKLVLANFADNTTKNCSASAKLVSVKFAKTKQEQVLNQHDSSAV
jgi:hypothetical protein